MLLVFSELLVIISKKEWMCSLSSKDVVSEINPVELTPDQWVYITLSHITRLLNQPNRPLLRHHYFKQWWHGTQKMIQILISGHPSKCMSTDTNIHINKGLYVHLAFTLPRQDRCYRKKPPFLQPAFWALKRRRLLAIRGGYLDCVFENSVEMWQSHV